MRKIFLILALAWGIHATFATTENHSIKPGEIFPDTDGVHLNAHGGGVLYHKGKYYLYGEHKNEKSNAAWVGVTCYSSKDLYNWKNESVALPVSDVPGSDIEAGCTLERPKVIYNKKTKTFVMWFHLELKGKGYSAARVGMATSKSPVGPFKFVRSYRPNPGIYPMNVTEEEKTHSAKPSDFKRSWTPEWKDALAKGMFLRRDFAGGQMSRDMTLFVDDDQKAYHIYSSEDNATLHIAELSDDYQSHSGKYIRFAPCGHNEAPALFKKEGVYWMITSGCTGWNPNAARLFRSKSIWGPWEQLPNPCVGEGADLTFRSQSTYVLPVAGKKNAYIYMGDRWTPKLPIDGRYVWLPVLFNEEGVPYLEWMDEWTLDVFKKNKK